MATRCFMMAWCCVAMVIMGLLPMRAFAAAQSSPETGGQAQWNTELVGRGGLFGAMRRKGCDPSQLAQVMIDNGIRTENLPHLSPKLPVRIFSGCSAKADATIASQSAAIIAYEMARIKQLRELSQLKTKVSALASENADLKSRGGDSSRIAELEGQVKDLEARLQLSRHALATTAINGPSAADLKSIDRMQAQYFAAGAFGAGLIALLVMSFGVSFSARNSVPKSIKVHYWGEKYVFTLSEGPQFKCPLPNCHERKIAPHNAQRHLERAHPELRVRVEPIQVMKGMAA